MYARIVTDVAAIGFGRSLRMYVIQSIMSECHNMFPAPPNCSINSAAWDQECSIEFPELFSKYPSKSKQVSCCMLMPEQLACSLLEEGVSLSRAAHRYCCLSSHLGESPRNRWTSGPWPPFPSQWCARLPADKTSVQLAYDSLLSQPLQSVSSLSCSRGNIYWWVGKSLSLLCCTALNYSILHTGVWYSCLASEALSITHQENNLEEWSPSQGAQIANTLAILMEISTLYLDIPTKRRLDSAHMSVHSRIRLPVLVSYLAIPWYCPAATEKLSEMSCMAKYIRISWFLTVSSERGGAHRTICCFFGLGGDGSHGDSTEGYNSWALLEHLPHNQLPMVRQEDWLCERLICNTIELHHTWTCYPAISVTSREHNEVMLWALLLRFAVERVHNAEAAHKFSRCAASQGILSLALSWLSP